MDTARDNSGSASPPAAVPGGLQFPGYQLLEILRQTRTGYWIRARQLRLGREVLLKVAPAGDIRAKRILEAETRLFEKIRHERLLTLIDYQSSAALARGNVRDAVAGVAFSILDFPPGKCLEEAVEFLSRREAVSLFAQLAGLFLAVHEQKIFLRQASPRDFFVDGYGRLRLASLEGLEACGIPAAELSPLWLAPGPPGREGDYFLLGLLLLFLVTKKVPVPQSVQEQPEKWIERAAGSLRSSLKKERPADARAMETAAVLLDLLLKSNRSPARTAEATAALQSIAGGPGPPHEPPDRASRNRRIAIAVLALCLLAVCGGLAAWLASGRGSNPQPAPRIVRPDGPRASPPAPTPPAIEGTKRETPVAELPPSRPQVPAIPDDEPPAAEVLPPSGEKLAGGAPGEGTPGDGAPQLPEKLPVPPATGGGRRTPLEKFIAEATFLAGRPAEEKSGERDLAWNEGAALAREFLEAARTSPAPRDRPPEEKNFWEALLSLRAAMAEDRMRRELFEGQVRFDARDRFFAEYDFSSRAELEDWPAADGSSRSSIFNGSLFVEGEALFKPGRFLKDRVQVRARFPASRGQGQPANLNIVLWRPWENAAIISSGDLPPEPVLFGWNCRFGSGFLPAAGGASGSGSDARKIPMPAACILRFSSPESFKAVWIQESRLIRNAGAVESIDLEWSAAGIGWRVNDKPVLPARDLEAIAGPLEPIRNRRGTVAFQAFKTPVEVDAITVEGDLDGAEIRREARKAAAAELDAQLPGWSR